VEHAVTLEPEAATEYDAATTSADRLKDREVKKLNLIRSLMMCGGGRSRTGVPLPPQKQGEGRSRHPLGLLTVAQWVDRTRQRPKA
jgi:hypothetical protein